jgi:hypothetical protein
LYILFLFITFANVKKEIRIMKEEEKKLLFQDLSARLPHHVRVKVWLKYGTTEEGPLDLKHNYGNVLQDAFYYNKIKDIKPYLRPLSSMTKEEREYIEDKCAFTTMGPIGGNFGLVMPVIAVEWLIDFYNSHHLDWRGLISKGLALEAPEGMYNIKEQ